MQGARLRRAREESALDASEAAKAAKISVSDLLAAEAGGGPQSVVEALIVSLGLSYDRIILGEAPPQPETAPCEEAHACPAEDC